MYFLNAFLCLQLDFLKIAPLLYRGNIEKRWAIGFRRNLLDMRKLFLIGKCPHLSSATKRGSQSLVIYGAAPLALQATPKNRLKSFDLKN